MSNSVNSGFFIVGTGRCGTTLFRNLLRYHPDVYVPRETHWLPILFHAYGLQKIRHTDFFRMLDSVYMAKGRTALERILLEEKLDAKEFRRSLAGRLSPSGRDTIAECMNAFYGLVAEPHGASIWGDKTPDYGLCMTMLQTLWPDAKFVHIYRDGRDVAISMKKVLSFRLLVAWGINHWYAVAYKKQYEQHISNAHLDWPIEGFFELWKSRLTRIFDERDRLGKPCYMGIRYEELLKDPPEILSGVSKFLGLPEKENWIDAAATSVRFSNVGKNQDSDDYVRLTKRYGDDLRNMGFLE